MSDKYISCSCGKCYLCNLVKRIVSERAKAEKFFLEHPRSDFNFKSEVTKVLKEGGKANAQT